MRELQRYKLINGCIEAGSFSKAQDEIYYTDAVDALLAEKEEKITELESLFAIQQTRMDKATKLWQEATGKTETLPDLGDLLDWLMERGTEAEQKLLNIKESREYQQRRAELAGQAYCVQFDAKIEATRNLKTATDALKAFQEHEPPEVVKDEFAYDRLLEAIHDGAKKALADIEGEKESNSEDREDIADAEETMSHSMDPNIKLTDYFAYRKERLADIEGEKEKPGNELDKFEISQETEEEYKKRLSIKGEKKRDIPLRHLPESDLPEPDWKWLEEISEEGDRIGQAILYLKQRADDERSRIILLGERIEKLENQ